MFNIFTKDIKPEKYIIATYALSGKEGSTLRDVAWNLAIGQSVGNPNVRNEWETDKLFEDHSCKVLEDEENLKKYQQGLVRIAFPTANTNFKTDGISHLLCQLMGGQMDIDIIDVCRLKDLEIPKSINRQFKKPTFGIDGIRKFTGVYNKPILGSIIKPKIGVSAQTLLKMVKQLVEGGVNFIKEDEIMASPACCPLKERLEVVQPYLNNQKVIYSYCINGDPHSVLNKARSVTRAGGNSVHANVWCGLGVYNSIRKLDKPLFIHFQKSGDKTFTDERHPYGIDWNVICKLAGLSGVDTIHNGMWGGYSSNDEASLMKSMEILHDYNVLPVLSCGMHPGLVNAVTERFGPDYMANVGGAIHGHPSGTKAGVKAMKQAISNTGGPEYEEAIEKWGFVS